MAETKLSPTTLDGRFSIVRTLGTGGFGRVLEAWDHEHDAPVALKNLHSVDPASLYAFKQEFRSLADVRHPNLVRLHELFNAGGEWWLVMELVSGVGFREWTLGGNVVSMNTAAVALAETLPQRHLPIDVATYETPSGAEHRFNEARVRSSLRQLVAGVQALHDAGKLHRDLKPSNVMVTPAGRVVILDFGLVADLNDGLHLTLDPRIKGTPAYMSPEQIMTQSLMPASDWYAVGTMLYETLRGKPPFNGALTDILVNKVSRDVTDPRNELPDLPADLVELSLSLLARDPTTRPKGQEILARMAEAPSSSEASTVDLVRSGPARPAGRMELVGRKFELQLLSEALIATRDGKPQVVRISGPSGIGKTALVRHFVERLAHTDTVVLSGRCYERETVPFKAFDGIVDALTQYLRAAPELESDRLVPRDAKALARLFPVYGRLPCANSGREAALDAPELRRRAFAALREVLTRIADAHPLVVWIDDLHWGDLDSAALLTDLLAPPDPPAILFLAAHRSEDAMSPLMLALQSLPALELDVGPLAPDAARTLANLLAGRDAENIARESGGSPLFVEALARHVRTGGEAHAVSLQEVLGASIRELAPAPRRLLELLAAAGGPLGQELLRKASGMAGEEAAEAESALRSARLIRSVIKSGGRDLDVLHAAIRETALFGLDAEVLRAMQRSLAEVLASASSADPETIARLYRAAGDPDSARPWAIRAADRAADALAFDQAAALYRVALDPPPREGAQHVRTRLAEALANAGRGPLAARAFLEAVPGATKEEALILERRAAETLLRSGHIDEGIEVVTRVLDQIGYRFPDSPARSLGALLLNRARLRLRGYGFKAKPSDQLDPRTLARIDVCWSIGNGFGGVDLIRAADFHARHMLLALDAGDPYRVARALSWESVIAGLEGGAKWKHAAMLTERAEAIAQEIAHPHALAWAVSGSAVNAWAQGSFRRSIQLCEYSEALFRERCADVGWEIGSLEFWWLLPALWFLGDTSELEKRAPASLKEASERGDLYAVTTARTYVTPRLMILAGKADEARREARDAIAAWSNHGFHLQHWTALIADCEADLYEGDATAALLKLDAGWKSVERAQHHRSVIVRCLTLELRGRVLLEKLSTGSDERRFAEVERCARGLEKEQVPWARGSAAMLRAGARAIRGQAESAAQAFAAAAQIFDTEELKLHAAVAHRRAGELAQNQDEVAAAVATLKARGAADPDLYTRFLAPGYLRTS